MIDITNPRLDDFARAGGLTATTQPAVSDQIKKLAERFCAAPLPDSVCADPCASMHGEPNRTGTNLLTVTEAAQILAYVLGGPKEQKPLTGFWNGYGFYGSSLSFEGGNLYIRLAGHGDLDGHGIVSFPGKDLEMDDEGYYAVALPNSELIAIRDQLNKWFPPALADEPAAWMRGQREILKGVL